LASLQLGHDVVVVVVVVVIVVVVAVWGGEEHESDAERGAQEVSGQSPQTSQQARQVDQGTSRTGTITFPPIISCFHGSTGSLWNLMLVLMAVMEFTRPWLDLKMPWDHLSVSLALNLALKVKVLALISVVLSMIYKRGSSVRCKCEARAHSWPLVSFCCTFHCLLMTFYGCSEK